MMNRDNTRFRVTAEEVARKCGVSRGTVDRALHGRSGISEKTREHILNTVEELGYRPHALARGLVKGRSLNIGLVTLSVHNPYISELIAATEMEARRNGYFTYVTNTDMEPDVEVECIEHLIDRSVDGIILQSINAGASYANWLESLQLPVVAFGNRISPNIPFVGIDDRTAAREATEYLHGHGYEEIAIVCPPLRYLGTTNIDAQEQRYLGFLDAMNRVAGPDKPPLVIRNKDFSALLDFVSNKNGDKAAVFCTSDIFALDVMNFLMERGYRIPRDVGIMGFDNIEILSYVRPRLATVDQMVKTIGQTAITRLLASVNGETIPANTVCPHRLVEGDSITTREASPDMSAVPPPSLEAESRYN